jgi:hypothetical protein
MNLNNFFVCAATLLVFSMSACGLFSPSDALATDTTPAEFCLEAEDFSLDKGWEVTDNGYFNSFPNLWSAKKIVADETDTAASCHQDIVVVESGIYNLWVHYESAYGFGSLFTIKVLQDGRNAFESTFGNTRQRKHFPFGRGERVQGPWWWHNTDLVYQGGQLYLNKGKARIIIQKDKNEVPGAKRYIDFIFLTSDLALTPGNDDDWTKPNILSHFRKPIYCKARLSSESAVPLYLKLKTQFWQRGYYSGPQAAYYVSKDGLSGKAPESNRLLDRGDETSTMRLEVSTALPTELHVSACDAKGARVSLKGVELAIGKSEKDIARRVVCTHDQEVIIIPWGLRVYEKGLLGGDSIMTLHEVLNRQLDSISAYHPAGRKPKRITITSGLSIVSPTYLHLIAATGLNGEFHLTSKEVYGKDAPDLGFITSKGFRSMQNSTLTKACYQQKFDDLEACYAKTAADMKRDGLGDVVQNIKLLEEPFVMSCSQMRTLPALNSAFRDYLQKCGVQPEDVLSRELLRGIVSSGTVPSKEELWSGVLIGNGMPDEAISNACLYYHSCRFRSKVLAMLCKRATECVEKYFQTGSRSNSGSIYPSSGEFSALMRGDDPFMLFRDRGATAFYSEMSWGGGGTAASLGAQTGSYEGTLARSLSKYYDVPMLGGLVCDPTRGYTPKWVRLYAYSLASQGISGLDLFTLALADCSAIGDIEMLKAIKDISYTLGDVEEYLVGAKVQAAKVALGWSSSTDVWDSALPPEAFPPLSGGNNVYPMERHCLFHALRHDQRQVDILSEEDVIEGYLKGYRVYFLVGDHLTPRAAEVVKEWVRQGGILISVAGGGFLDNYNRPLDVLKEVYGISDQDLSKHSNWVRPKLELVHSEPIDTITFSNAGLNGMSLEVYAYRQQFTPKSAEIWGVYGNGKPAVLCNAYGKGRAVIVGALPGLAYVKHAIPQKPYGRSKISNDELSSFIPVNYLEDVRRFLDAAIALANISKEIETSEPLVESTIMQCEDRNTLIIPLVNHSLKSLSRLNVSLDLCGITSITSRTHGPIPFRELNGRTVFNTSLAEVDFLVVKR